MNYLKQLLSLSFGTALLFLTLSAFPQADNTPQPYGGNKLMKEFICDEMIYPQAALDSKTEGTVEVAFTVMPGGEKKNYRIKKSVSPELDREALRICKLILYHPARKSTNVIISDEVIAVKFNIKKYQRNCKKWEGTDYVVYEGAIDTSMTIYATEALDKIPSPAFKDAAMSFGKYVQENMKYPDLAYKENMAGDVILNFVVETSGRISNIEVDTPLGGGCTEEAIQLIKQLRWNPGIRKGIAVRSFMTASINFSLNNTGKHEYLPNNNNKTM